jgi:hypothetical protein
MSIGGYRRAEVNFRGTHVPHAPNQIGLLNRPESFNTEQNYGRSITPGQGQVRMEIVIKRHACSHVLPREQQDILIRGATETNFGDVDCVPPLRPEQCRGVHG